MDAPMLARRGSLRVPNRRAARPAPASRWVRDAGPATWAPFSRRVPTSLDPGLPGSPCQHHLETPRLKRTCCSQGSSRGGNRGPINLVSGTFGCRPPGYPLIRAAGQEPSDVEEDWAGEGERTPNETNKPPTTSAPGAGSRHVPKTRHRLKGVAT